jgi:hypothetical protein
MYKLRLYPHHLNQVILAKATEKRKRGSHSFASPYFFVENNRTSFKFHIVQKTLRETPTHQTSRDCKNNIMHLCIVNGFSK